MNLEDYITYIHGKGINGAEAEGVGFFVSNLFITAGHVIKEGSDLITCCQGVTYKLKESDAIYYSNMDDHSITPDGDDIAIFRFDGINSPLKLSSELPNISMELQTVAKRKHSVSDGKSIFNQKEIIQSHSFGTKVVDVHDKLMVCSADNLGKGDSGCPLLNGDDVFGLLIAGQPGTDVCVFQSSKSIVKILKDIEYE